MTKINALLLAGTSFVLVACGTPDAEQQRGKLGKADVVGSCLDENGNELCGFPGTGNCHCDQVCENYGDCCADRDQVCVEGCTPATCEDLGMQCENWPDGCGGKALCGECEAGRICESGQCVPKGVPQAIVCTVGAQEPFSAGDSFLMVMNETRTDGMLLTRIAQGEWSLLTDSAQANVSDEGSMYFGSSTTRIIEEGDEMPMVGCKLRRIWEFRITAELTGVYEFNGFYLPTEGVEGCDDFNLGHPPSVSITCQAY